MFLQVLDSPLVSTFFSENLLGAEAACNVSHLFTIQCAPYSLPGRGHFEGVLEFSAT